LIQLSGLFKPNTSWLNQWREIVAELYLFIQSFRRQGECLFMQLYDFLGWDCVNLCN